MKMKKLNKMKKKIRPGDFILRDKGNMKLSMYDKKRNKKLYSKSMDYNINFSMLKMLFVLPIIAVSVYALYACKKKCMYKKIMNEILDDYDLIPIDYDYDDDYDDEDAEDDEDDEPKGYYDCRSDD